MPGIAKDPGGGGGEVVEREVEVRLVLTEPLRSRVRQAFHAVAGWAGHRRSNCSALSGLYTSRRLSYFRGGHVLVFVIDNKIVPPILHSSTPDQSSKFVRRNRLNVQTLPILT